MINFPSQYNLSETEKKWQKSWYESNLYKWDSNVAREKSFVIDTPPPTVSGSLHMGHVFSYTQADFVARYQRMKGMNVFYPIGFDDNGLPTERLVEKVKNVRGANMERSEFQKLCHQVVDEAEEEFFDLFKTVALSIDCSQKYQTISAQTQKISQLSFLDMCAKEEVYRKLQPCLWDPTDRTALAQADVVDTELAGVMYDIIFTTEKDLQITIATTRPELIPACVAILYNSNDPRYAHLANQHAITPIFGVKIPIIADDSVDVEKGTGLVMCCTFGDITDIDWWRKHDLPLRVIIDKAGKITLSEHLALYSKGEQTQKAIESIEGCKVKDAHKIIVELLRESGLVTNESPVIRFVKCAERSGSPLEILVTPQWFIKILDKKQALLEKSNQLNWHPSYMKVRLDNWIEGLNWDWCISRQRFFGVPIPVWYSKRVGEEGKVILPRPQDLPVDPINNTPFGYSKDEVEGEMDVMDTWATSAVSPQINSLAINDEYAIDLERHKKLFPADLRPQAHEIIRTWTFYTMVKALIHENSLPWKNIILSGWCLAADKTKMSKSKGNVVTPGNLIREQGADIVRYWASNSKLGTDIAYSEETFKIGKKLINKLWNATKFAATNIEQTQFRIDDINHPVDLWIISKLQQTVKKATEEFEVFEYCNARSAIEEFFWKYFCDNYLEIVKIRVYDQEQNNKDGQKSAQAALLVILDTVLRLFAPFIPHITEELFSIIFKDAGSIHRQGTWPKAENLSYDAKSLTEGDDLVQILDIVRKEKADRHISLKVPINKLSIASEEHNLSQATLDDLKNVTNANAIEIISNQDYAFDYVTENKRYSLKFDFE